MEFELSALEIKLVLAYIDFFHEVEDGFFSRGKKSHTSLEVELVAKLKDALAV